MDGKHSYLDQVADYRREQEWRRHLLAARVPRSLVIKAGSLAALGGPGALAQLLAACRGSSTEVAELTQVSTEGSFKWSKYPLIEKYNYRNLQWPTTPYYDGVSIGNHGGGPSSWDIVRVQTNSYGCIYDTVTGKQYGPDVQMLRLGPGQPLRGRAAESWSHAPDYSYWDFALRPNIYFHDFTPVNGRLFTPEDLQYSLDVHRTANPSKANLASIDRIEVRGQTARIFLKRPSLELPLILANPVFLMFAREHYEGPLERWQRQPIGTAAFKMVFNNVGSELKLARHERYHERYVNGDDRYPSGYKRPFLSGEESVALAQGVAEIAAFRSGQRDHFRPADLEQLQDLIATNPEAVVQIGGQDGSPQGRSLNVQDPILRDVRVRRALSMALDRKTMSETLYGGMGHGTFRYQWGHLGYDDPPTVEEMAEYSPWLRFDPDRARALLTEAGYPNGFELEYLISAAPTSQDIILQQSLEHVGVKVVFKQVESVVATQARINRTFKHITSWASVTSFEPSGPARAFWLSDSPNNFGGINDPVITDLVDKITYTLDPREQELLIRQLNDRDVDQQYHLLLPTQMQTFIWQPWLHNVVNAPSGNYQVFSHYQYENVWVDDTAPAERRGRRA